MPKLPAANPILYPDLSMRPAFRDAFNEVDEYVRQTRESFTPASASAPGETGDIRWDADFLYVCVAPNTWKRTAIASWV